MMKIYNAVILVLLCWLVKSMEIDENMLEQIREYKNSYLQTEKNPYYQAENQYAGTPLELKETTVKSKQTNFNFQNHRLLQKSCYRSNHDPIKFTNPILCDTDFFKNVEFKKMAKCKKKQVLDELNQNIEYEMKEIHPDIVKKSAIASQIYAVTQVCVDGIQMDRFMNPITQFRLDYAIKYWENMKNAVHYQILKQPSFFININSENFILKDLVVKTFLSMGWRDYDESRDKIKNGKLTGVNETDFRLVYDYYYALKVIEIGKNKMYKIGDGHLGKNTLHPINTLLPELIKLLDKYEQTQKDTIPSFMFLEIKKFYQNEEEFCPVIVDKVEFPRIFESTNCPEKHGLKSFKTLTDSFECNECGNKLEKGTTMNGCRKCDFDLCTDCSKNVRPENPKNNFNVENESNLKKEKPCFKLNCLIV